MAARGARGFDKIDVRGDGERCHSANGAARKHAMSLRADALRKWCGVMLRRPK